MYSRTERLLPLLVLLGVTACSGAADSGLFGPSPTDSTSPTEPGGQASGATGSSSSGGSTTPAPPADPATPGTPAPAPTEPTKPQDPAPAACAKESEPNDLLGRATPFTGCIAGEIGNPVDSDFVEIVAPANANKMRIARTDNGKLSYRIFEDGDVKVSNATSTTSLSVDGGSTYAFRITASQPGLDKLPYELKITFE